MEKPCTIVLSPDKGEPPNATQLREQLESGNPALMCVALKRTILMLLEGETIPGILMTVIRFAMPSRSHEVKKLLLLFWEVIDKTGPDGKLLPEMILVCNFIRNDLTHPNEYVRGSTLRFLCKMKEVEVVQPLVPSIIANLEHRLAYVRRNAVICIYSLYKAHPDLMADAPRVVFDYLQQEGDASCKRNAFMMLFNCDVELAMEYLSTVLEQLATFPDIMQLVFVEMVRKVARAHPQGRSKFFKVVFTLLESQSPSVQFAAAGALCHLSQAPTAIKAAASGYIRLLCQQSDNNVKMIVLDRLVDLKRNHPRVLQQLLMDVLRALSTPNMDIRRKTLDIALDLVSPKNIEEVIALLKKEVNKTQGTELEHAAEYRQMLIKAIHQCAVKFPEVAHSVVHVLMDFLSDNNVSSAIDVVVFIREVVESYPLLRPDIIGRLLDELVHVRASKVIRHVLWLVGEYSESQSELDVALSKLKSLLGTPPFFDTKSADDEKKDEKDKENQEAATEDGSSGSGSGSSGSSGGGGAPKLNPDGTYAMQSALSEAPSVDTHEEQKKSPHKFRTMLQAGDFFLGSAIATTLVKLALRLKQFVPPMVQNSLVGDILLTITGMLSLGASGRAAAPIDTDSQERLVHCVKVLSQPSSLCEKIFLEECRTSFRTMLADVQSQKKALTTEAHKEQVAQADDLIKIRQLRQKSALGQASDIEDEADGNDLNRATGEAEKEVDMSTRLSRILQLTGFSDPIYAEAFVNVHQYDIVLEVMVINQTNDTLQNVCLELATLGDLKLCERPQNYTVGPRDKRLIKANIKVSSTETGIIFGNLVYDVAGSSSSDKNCVILNDIHIDIMDYITPSYCSQGQFRSMWVEFEWENKVAVNTSIADVDEFLAHILKCTNMACLTPPSALEGSCGFLSANLYAKSIFGEDALANLSIEQQPDGKIGGFIRIRSKTQGIALSLGDKITLKQKSADLLK